MAHLVTGYAGTEHIQSADQGSFNAAFFGDGQFVMEIGNQFDASITSNNNVRVLDGDMLMYGRHVRINPNTYEDLTIQTGTAGKNRMDLIVMTYEKDANDGTETAYLEVIQGAESEGTPTRPSYVNGNILEGATKNQMPLYEVVINGVVLADLNQLFTTCPTYKALAEQYEAEFQEACETYLGSLNILDTKELIDANTQPNQLAGALAVKEISTLLSRTAGTWIGGATISSGSTSYTIANANITSASIIDIYYSESSKEVVSNAKASYTQSSGSLTITFENALDSDVTISNIKVVNP